MATTWAISRELPPFNFVYQGHCRQININRLTATFLNRHKYFSLYHKYTGHRSLSETRIANAAGSAIDVSPPPIDDDLYEVMRENGADFGVNGVPATFGNDDAALMAASTGVAVFDMSHSGRIRVSGADRLRFLHNQSTAAFLSLTAGQDILGRWSVDIMWQGCDTVFITPTARTIDLATAWVMETAVIVAVSPEKRELVKMLDRYIFPADKVEVADITDKTSLLALVGPSSDEVLVRMGLDAIVGSPYGHHMHSTFQGSPVTVTVGSGVTANGYRFLVAPEVAGPLYTTLLTMGSEPMGAAAWERLRIAQGRPAPGKELTNEFNPLEAGLWSTISTTKGCYIGQETIARLITYDGVKQQLWGVRVEGEVSAGATVLLNGEKVGKLTSSAGAGSGEGGGSIGLAYLKRHVKEGDGVDVEGLRGEVVDVPFLLHALPGSAA